MKAFNSILGLLLLFTALATEAKLPPPGTGKADVPANILIMLDVSGSMSARTNSGGLRNPEDASVDSQGNVFIVDRRNNRVY